MNRAILFFLAVALVFSGGMVIYFANRMTGDLNPSYPDGPTAVIDPGGDDDNHVLLAAAGEGESTLTPEEVESFTLTNTKGEAFQSDSLKGEIWVGSIFFSSCPSTCRMQNMRVAELQKRFGDKGVEFVSITCDPSNDTPSVLSNYSMKFGAKEGIWHFLTGDFALIQKIGTHKFGITIDDKVHSDRLVLFDRQGEKVGSFRSLDPDQFEELLSKLEQLTADEKPSAE